MYLYFLRFVVCFLNSEITLENYINQSIRFHAISSRRPMRSWPAPDVFISSFFFITSLSTNKILIFYSIKGSLEVRRKPDPGALNTIP